MKHTLLRICLLALALCLAVLCLAACGNKNDTSTAEDGKSTTETAKGGTTADGGTNGGSDEGKTAGDSGDNTDQNGQNDSSETPKFSEGLEYLSNGDGTCGVRGIGTCTDTEILIPTISPDGETVIYILNGAFQNRTELTSVVVPDSVTYIADHAFSGCSGLTSITIPFVGGRAGITANDSYQLPFGYIFGTVPYEGGTATTQYYYGNGKNIINDTYYIPTSLTTVTVTGGNILRGSFGNCGNLVKITVPATVTALEDLAFNRCGSLTTFTVPNGVVSIGEDTFADCNRLQGTTYENAVYLGNEQNPHMVLLKAVDTAITTCSIHPNTAFLNSYAFEGCAELTAITVPQGIARIEKSAFSGCKKLADLTVSGGVAYIGNSAFYGCSALASVVIPNSVEILGKNAFSQCTNLASIDLGNGIAIIGEGAFSGCTKLSSVTILESVTDINQSAFYNCTGLRKVYITDLAKWCAISFHGSEYANPLYYAHKLYIGDAEATDITVPASRSDLQSSDWYAFAGCTGLTRVTFADGIRSIASYSLQECSQITEIVIPASVKYIQGYAFSGCSKLATIRFGGTSQQWNDVVKNTKWNDKTGYYTVICEGDAQ